MARSQTKTATLTPRIPPEVKEPLAAAAKADRRNLASVLEVIAFEYCKRRGIRSVAAPTASGAA